MSLLVDLFDLLCVWDAHSQFTVVDHVVVHEFVVELFSLVILAHFLSKLFILLHYFSKSIINPPEFLELFNFYFHEIKLNKFHGVLGFWGFGVLF